MNLHCRKETEPTLVGILRGLELLTARMSGIILTFSTALTITFTQETMVLIEVSQHGE